MDLEKAKGNKSVLVTLDIKAAYDNININILKHKLAEYSQASDISNTIINLFSNRKNFVKNPDTGELLGP